MTIIIKSDDEVKIMREAGQIVGQTLQQIREMVKPGINLLEIESFVEEEFKRRGAVETFRNYKPGPQFPPYPSNVCASVNDELVHGIPTDRVLNEGDIVTFDLGATYKGFVGDSAITVPVGEISDEAKNLLKVTEESLFAGIKAAQAGDHLNDICTAIEESILASASNYSIVTNYVGHGVGREMHEDPQVPNYRLAFKGPRLRHGLVLALEPMVNVGTPETYECEDGWTVRTADGTLSCHFEHTIAIREGREAEVLTLP